MGLHKKRQSKRVSLHMKHKIEKKIRDHRRKARKEGTGRKVLKKDPGIPNLHPYKAELLAQMERKQEKLEEEKVRQKEQRRAKVNLLRKGGVVEPPKSLEKMMKDAQRRTDRFDAVHEAAAADGELATNQKTFLKELNKVIDSSDVIIEVLDARDPMGCRCPQIERMIMDSGNKKIVLLLNKIDLVPRAVVQQWLTYLRGFYPTIAFKASTQVQRQHLGQAAPDAEQAPESMLKSAECLGATTLIQLLKNYCRSMGVKTGITVGIIGYPNVGKSSVINSLKRTKAVSVGSTPGVTKAMQEVHLDKLVKLLDCPGIVFNTGSGVDAVLRNSVKIEQIEDPIEPVAEIVKRCTRDQLMVKYNVPKFKDPSDFLYNVAKNLGRVKKGGVPDLEAAARAILRDWNEGRIAYYTVPPAQAADVHVGAQIMSSYGQELKLDEIAASEQATVLAGLSDAPADFVAMEASELRDEEMFDEDGSDLDDDEDDDSDSDQMSEGGVATGSSDDDSDNSDSNAESGSDMSENEEAVAAAPVRGARPTGPKVKRGDQLLSAAERDVNPQTNQQRKKDIKQQKKVQRKGMSGAAASAPMEGDDDTYRFGQYFA